MLPIGMFAGYRVLRANYEAYATLERHLHAADEALRARYGKQQVHAALAAFLTEAGQLRRQTINTKQELWEWKAKYESWIATTTSALIGFGLSSEAAVFRNADSSGPNVESEPPVLNNVFDVQAWVPYLDHRLRKHQTALEEILKNLPRSL